MDAKLTRSQVAKVLSCGTSTVRRLEESGDLTPERGERGMRLFDPEQVEGVRAARAKPANGAFARVSAEVEPADPDSDGDDDLDDEDAGEGGGIAERDVAPSLVALIFADINAGVPLCEIVMTREIDPAIVERTYAQYVRLSELSASMPDASARIAAIEQAQSATLAELTRVRRALDVLGWHLQHLPATARALAESAAMLSAVDPYA